MIKTVTSATLFNDAVGKRISLTYATIDEATGKIVSDNERTDRVVTDKKLVKIMDDIMEAAQGFIEEE